MKRWLPIIIILAILLIPGFVLPRFGTQAVTASVAVRPEVLLTVGGFEITNTLFTTWIVTILLTLFVFFSTRKMKTIPSGLQNVLEMIIEALDGLTTSVAGSRGRKTIPTPYWPTGGSFTLCLPSSSRKNLSGIWSRMPAPSEALGSAPTAPR